MQPQRFKASLSSLVIIITVLACALVLTISLVTYFSIYPEHQFVFLPLGFVWTALIVAYGFRPLYYELNDSVLTVKCPFWTFSYPINTLQNVRLADRSELRYTIRVFGSGGFLGNFGIFYNKQLKWMTWFATRMNNYVVAERTVGRKLLFTPDDPQGFIDALKKFPG